MFEITNGMLRALSAYVHVDSIFVAKRDGETNSVAIVSHHSEVAAPLGDLRPLIDHVCSLAHGGRSESPRAVVIPDLSESLPNQPWAGLPLRGCFLGVPIRWSNEDAYGALCLFGFTPHPFTRDEIALVESLAGLLSWSLERQRNEVLFRSLIDQSSMGYCMTQGESIVYENESFRRHLGTVEKTKLLANHDFTYSAPDGSVIDVKRTQLIISGRPLAVYRSADITKFVSAERRSIVGELAAGIAHEVRNPLTFIKGFFQMLADDSIELTPDLLRLVKNEIEQIELLSSEMLTLSKPHTRRKAPVDVEDILRSAVTLIEPEMALRNVQLATHVAPVPTLLCDAHGLTQVFVNLMKNAIEAMPQGGTLTVRIDREGDNAAIVFQDEGEGIPPERIAKLGTPFMTTKESGTGLGLVVCMNIVQSHNGRIEFSSEVGHGTTVKVTLPIHD